MYTSRYRSNRFIYMYLSCTSTWHEKKDTIKSEEINNTTECNQFQNLNVPNKKQNQQ